jgi:hypothetical protein
MWRSVATRLAARACRHRACSTDAAAQAAEQAQRRAAAAEGDSRTLAYALGFCGMLPFAALTQSGHSFLDGQLKAVGGKPLPFNVDDAQAMQVLYGSSIVSFLGAPHWGLALAGGPPFGQLVRYGWGVTPSLLAWPLPAMPLHDAQLGLVLSLGACLAADVAFMSRGLLPRWYLFHLRVPLTLVASASVLSNTKSGAKAVVPPLALPAAPPAPTRSKGGGWLTR